MFLYPLAFCTYAYYDYTYYHCEGHTMTKYWVGVASKEHVQNKIHWGFKFRFGLFEVPRHDFLLIAQSMGVDIEK